MGSLTSTPKAPQRQAVVAPVAVATASAATQPNSSEITEKKAESSSREKTLLARNRGRFGTIATSLKGLLGLKNTTISKTLLGE